MSCWATAWDAAVVTADSAQRQPRLAEGTVLSARPVTGISAALPSMVHSPVPSNGRTLPALCQGDTRSSSPRAEGLTSPLFSEMAKDDHVSALLPDIERYKRIRKHYLDLMDSSNLQSTLGIF